MGLMAASGGCSALTKSRSEADAQQKNLTKLMVAPDPPALVREAAVPHGLTFLSVEGVAVVNGLPGTGGPIAPSPFRDEIIDEMKHREIPDPHLFLELPETALVRVQAIIPPAARRGDILDLRIISPPKTDATDLHGGWLMDTRLRQQQKLAGAVRKSDVLAIGQGAITSRADHETGEDVALRLQGTVVGGGRVQQDRKLGLVIRPEYQHVKTASQLTAAINDRFYFFDGSKRSGIAKAIEDDFIEVQVHPRYRHNIHRLMAVIAMVCPQGESAQTQTVLADLGLRLKQPTTADEAGLQLEAIGNAAIPTLIGELTNPNAEVRFHAAQALAYLDRNEAIEPLAQLARDEAAFRYQAIVAIEGMTGRPPLDALKSLFDSPSMEARYGALRSIRRRVDRDTAVRSTHMQSGYRLYRVPSTAAPFIAVSLTEAPEIVCFGEDDSVAINDFLHGTGGIVIRPHETAARQLHVSRFTPGGADKRVEVPATIEGLLTGIDMVGGGYGDAIAILRKAKTNNQITCGLALDPLPQSLRTYHRDAAALTDPAQLPPEDIASTNPDDAKSSWWSLFGW